MGVFSSLTRNPLPVPVPLFGPCGAAGRSFVPTKVSGPPGGATVKAAEPPAEGGSRVRGRSSRSRQVAAGARDRAHERLGRPWPARAGWQTTVAVGRLLVRSVVPVLVLLAQTVGDCAGFPMDGAGCRRLRDDRPFSLFTGRSGVTNCPVPQLRRRLEKDIRENPETLKATANGGPHTSGRAGMIQVSLT